jgi:N-acetylmuramoyl-L-alanine amidase
VRETPRAICRAALYRTAVLLFLLAPVWPGLWPATASAEPDPESVRLLARTIYHEARGEGRIGMVAIGWVVLNRLSDSSHPETVADVILQRNGKFCQWVWVCEFRNARPTEAAAWEEAQAIARELLTDPPPDPTKGAIWIRQLREGMPSWDNGKIRTTARIGNHFFLGRERRTIRPVEEEFIPARLVFTTAAADHVAGDASDEASLLSLP